MDQDLLRRLVRDKLASGGLPRDVLPRVWGGPGRGEACDASDAIVTAPQMVMDGIGDTGRGIRMHVECFNMWEHERRAMGYEPRP